MAESYKWLPIVWIISEISYIDLCVGLWPFTNYKLERNALKLRWRCVSTLEFIFAISTVLTVKHTIHWTLTIFHIKHTRYTFEHYSLDQLWLRFISYLYIYTFYHFYHILPECAQFDNTILFYTEKIYEKNPRIIRF